MKICEENQVTGVMVTTMDEAVLLSDRIVMPRMGQNQRLVRF